MISEIWKTLTLQRWTDGDWAVFAFVLTWFVAMLIALSLRRN